MATNYTSNYQLCQWEESDQVNRLEFNQDNSRIEEALSLLASKMTQIETSLSQISTTVTTTASNAYSSSNPNVACGYTTGTGAAISFKLPFTPKGAIIIRYDHFWGSKGAVVGMAVSGGYSSTGGTASGSSNDVTISGSSITISAYTSVSGMRIGVLAFR